MDSNILKKTCELEKEKAKSQKGITLIALGIAMVIILMISGISIGIGVETIEMTKKTAYILELEMIQIEVDRLNALVINEKSVVCNDTTYTGEEIYYLGEELTTSQEELVSDIYEEFEGYMYYSVELLEELGITEITQGYLLNVKSRDVVATIGYSDNDGNCYTLEQLGRNKYIVEYTENI